MMAGVFSILKGCVGVEEQAIARALHFLRGGRANLGAASGGGRDGDGFSAGLEEEERQEWQAHREASMAVLVQRAMSAAPPGRIGGEVRAAAEMGRGGGRSGSGGKRSTSAYRSRRLQVRSAQAPHAALLRGLRRAGCLSGVVGRFFRRGRLELLAAG